MALLTVAEAAARLDRSERTIRDALTSGSMAGRKLGRDWFVEEDEVDRYGRENRGKPGRKPAARPASA